MFLGAALVVFDLAINNVPGLRDAHLPYPDVRLAATAQRVPLAGEDLAAGHTFVVVEAGVRSVYGNRGETLDLYTFELESEGITYEYASASFDLDGACDETIVQAGGTASCKVVFEVPDTVGGGKLSYDSLTAHDSTDVTF